MPAYLYIAKDGPGKTVEGELLADSRSAVLATVESMGYIPVSVVEKTADGTAVKLPGLHRISRGEITVFTRQLASLTKSGVAILRALTTIAGQTPNASLRTIIEELRNTTRDGRMLSEGLARYPQLFPDIYISMVRAGESAGMLDTVLFRLAEAREAEEETRRKVQAAMAYPTLILTVGAATVFILLSFFLPKVVDMFANYRHGQLPLPTRLLLGASTFFSHQWHWILVCAVMLWAVYRRMAVADKGKALIDHVKLRIPFINDFIVKNDIARFARTLALMINSGIAIEKALVMSADTVQNSIIKAEIDKARRLTVQQGRPFSTGLGNAPHFPPFVANMTAVGEESGHLDDALVEVASYYEKELDQRIRLTTSLIEPILILIVGAIVGFIVAAMLLPIFALSTSVV